MLVTNGDCELPCWWGITPSETTWQEVRDRLGLYYGQGYSRPGGVRLYEVDYGDRIYPYPPPYGYHIHIEFTEQDGIVQSIRVRSNLVRDTTPERFAQDWQRYAPYQVLVRYGEPLQVNLHIVPWTPEYTLGLAYEHLGFDIVYGGTPTRISPTTMRVCFDFAKVNFMYLELESPQPEETTHEGTARPLEEVTEMDIETFYALLRDPGSEICFETPTELWP